MNNLLDDFMKYANSNDDEDEYFGPPGMTDAESKEKYDRLLATSKKLRGVGLAATLAGSGLRYVTPEIAKSRARLLADQRTKLKERHRAHRNPHGFMVVTPEMGQTHQRVGQFGKGVALMGALLMGAGRASAGVAHRKRINYLEHALREKSKEQEKTAGDVVDFASHAKKVADRNALKAKLVNPEDPIRKAQGAIQAYLDKEKEQQAESEMRWSKINNLQASIDSDMEQLRQMDEREAKMKLRSKKITKGVGIAGAGLATLGGGAYLYNRYKKKKRAQAEQEKTAAPMFGKDRYHPVGNFTRGQTFRRELQLMDDDQKNGSNYDPEYYKKIKGKADKADKAFFRDASGTMVSAVSLLAALRNAKKGVKAALSGDKDAANHYKKLTGIASIYPTYRLAKNLKNRYHWSKQENIDQDDAFRKKDQEITDRWSKRFYPNGDPDDDDFDYNKSNTDDPELLELIKMEKRKKDKLK